MPSSRLSAYLWQSNERFGAYYEEIQPAMIIELYGPPGAGKTTFAKALKAHLRHAGYTVELVFSSRPAERNTESVGKKPSKGFSTLLSRLMRPVAGIALIARGRRTASWLIELNPPSKLIWRLRLTQYLMRLSHSWALASRADHVVLFDQGYVQLICTLILLGSREVDDKLLSELLDAMPVSGLLVSLKAPPTILEERLRERLRLQHPIERLLELDMKSNLDCIEVLEKLDEMLRERGLRVVNVSSLDPSSLEDGLALIESKLNEMLPSRQAQPTSLSVNAHWHEKQKIEMRIDEA